MKNFSSPGKIKVRQHDLRLISELSRKANRKLTYLGLPSPWLGDIAAWKPFLSEIFAIEREQLYLTHLMDKAYSLGLFEQVFYFCGDIDNIFREDIDEYGKSIEKIFPIDLINLDYCEGLDYREFSKLSTIEAIIEKQKGSLLTAKKGMFPYFLIFLTHNIPSHEGNPEAKKNYLKFLTKDIKYFEPSLKEKIQAVLNWYLSSNCPPSYQHKCFVMGKLFEVAHPKGFKVIPKKIIQYAGDKNAVMLHYQFQITPMNLSSPIPVDNKMDIIDILNYSVIDELDNNIVADQPIIVYQL